MAVSMTERYAEGITVSGTETVSFPVAHSVYGVYADDGLMVSLKPDAQEGDQGVYTVTGGKVTIAHYTNATTLYLFGPGVGTAGVYENVKVWGGQSPLDDPFGA
jgi:hypothetical protein